MGFSLRKCADIFRFSKPNIFQKIRFSKPGQWHVKKSPAKHFRFVWYTVNISRRSDVQIVCLPRQLDFCNPLLNTNRFFDVLLSVRLQINRVLGRGRQKLSYLTVTKLSRAMWLREDREHIGGGRGGKDSWSMLGRGRGGRGKLLLWFVAALRQKGSIPGKYWHIIPCPCFICLW